MSLTTYNIYRIILKVNALQRPRWSSSYKVVMYKRYITFVIDPPLMMAQSRAENTWEINNHGKYIDQFSPNTIKSIQQYERINRKICRQKRSIIFNEIYIYIYISSSRMDSSPPSLSLSLSLSQSVPIFFRYCQVFQTTSNIHAKLNYRELLMMMMYVSYIIIINNSR